MDNYSEDLRAAQKAALARSAGVSGLASGTAVLTLDGEIPVEFLNEGDRVVTRSGLRTLRAVHVQILCNAQVVRVSGSALGHGRPDRDAILAPGQSILLRDWRARALYGVEAALVPAARLVDGAYVSAEPVAAERIYLLEFDEAEVIYAGGLELGCAAVTVAA
ncbi:MAG: Hint domain-containing protein [Paracoccaceae bacterium]